MEGAQTGWESALEAVEDLEDLVEGWLSLGQEQVSWEDERKARVRLVAVKKKKAVAAARRRK